MPTLPPPCRIALHGQSYGGAYWNEAEFTLVLKAVDANTWHAELEDSGGGILDAFVLDKHANAKQLLAVTEPRRHTPYSVPGLNTDQIAWDVSVNLSDEECVVRDFDEIRAWLNYFLGNETWPTNQKEWEY